MAGHGATLSGSTGFLPSPLLNGLTSYTADSSAKLLDQLKVGALTQSSRFIGEGLAVLSRDNHSPGIPGTTGR